MVGRGRALTGRRAERGALDRLAGDVRAGQSRALVVHGEPGVGKSALLDYLAGRASGCRVARASGVQSEMELPLAGLHQLCTPMLDRLDRLPAPQRDALGVAFGLRSGQVADRFLIGLAVLTLLSDVAEERPLLCLVDDEQWLDRTSVQVLAFVARRLGAESVGLVFGTRVSGGDLAGLPELPVNGLPDTDARALLDTALTGPMDERVRDQILAEARGNPLALLELPRGLTAVELAGGFGLPGAVLPGGSPGTGGVEESFRRRVDVLPADTRRLLLLAAADPTGDTALVRHAASLLGIGIEAAAPATEAGLAEFGVRTLFRHPLVRSVVYRSAAPAPRREVHEALAEVTDPSADPDRRAWHRAQAAAAPDQEIAEELERSADRARSRGGPGAAAAFLERAAMLTLDPARRAGRALAAAGAKAQAGALDAALDLLVMAEAGPLSEMERARVALLRAQLAFTTDRGGDAPLLLVQAAVRFEPIAADLARATHLDALVAASLAGRLASPGGHVLDVARAAVAAPRPSRPPRSPDLLLDGWAANFTEGYAAGVPILQQAVAAFHSGESADEDLRWLWLAAMDLWDDERWDEFTARYLRHARASGALSELPLALSGRAYVLLFTGNLAAATSLVEELRTVKEATGSKLVPYSALFLAALRGRQEEVSALVEATGKEAVSRGEGIGIAVAEWTNAVLHNGLGDYPAAMAAAQRALHHQEYPAIRYPGIANWAAPEFVEAAVRSGMSEAAADACRWIAEMTAACRTDWVLGVEARSRALLAEGDAAERLYRDAITYLGKGRIRTDLARAHLLYGEWLRRERRRTDAREQLHKAHRMLEAMGITAFAERAGRELRATGERTRKRTIATRAELTAQEAQIARLARDGLSNPEIATRLFISARTVQYHLGKVFQKLGITSRSQLDRVLS
ncbi:helix-turn-helix transcriptional regulator [Actinomadura geliboluensis]|uniref:LuxR family transcriptional regulator n=1 Tax=Actinomadura geliboluensis TaxID=882440 RepID=A0A5S4GM21_9ACTN|nr:LuxR family transcriptional regulator [Actinomadura geliboluensis]TMR33923.1 LuxR family transcriptional regulator [Actinomadura geliboluensis]